ncbi:MAG TPA: MFS transporter [Propionibacteriaceae bacterium]|nr:MFS transporter [Propionibacteriaceae bacterium]
MPRPFRPAGRGNAERTFYVLTGVSTFCFTLSFTVNLVYMATVVGLTPFQLVLVGTVLEITGLLFEVPTGIVADLHSRRTSVLIGCGLIGLGLLLQAVPLLVTVLAAQVVWGIGSTFTSGATQAWITDEVGEQRVAAVFAREQQIHLGATLLGTVAAGLLSLAGLAVPMVISGLGFLALTLWLLREMPERNFTATPLGQRETFRHMATTFRAGLRLAAVRPVVRGLLLVTVLAGLASEAFDRLWLVRILEEFPLPALFGTDSVGLWFAGFSLVGSTVALVASLLVNRRGAAAIGTRHPGWVLAVLAALQVLCVLAVALGGSIWLVLAGFWLRGAAYALAAPVEATWLNSELPSDIRATVLSMNGQVNAVGQIVGGPPLGALASRASVGTALVVSAGVLAPAVAVYGWLGRRRTR